MMYNRQNIPEMPQANSYDYSTISPQLAQLITMLSQNQGTMPIMPQGQQQNPMFAQQVIRPRSAIRNKWEMVREAAQEPVSRVTQTVQPAPAEVQYVKPPKVKKMSDGTVKRWSSYDDAWIKMSAEEIKQYEAAGGVIGG